MVKKKKAKKLRAELPDGKVMEIDLEEWERGLRRWRKKLVDSETPFMDWVKRHQKEESA